MELEYDREFYKEELRKRVEASKTITGKRKRHETFEEIPDQTHHESPESLASAKELAGIVNAAMDELSDDLRQAISLREIDGLSYEEISAAMDCPVGTVRSRIFRAREAISEKIRPLLEKQSGKRW